MSAKKGYPCFHFISGNIFIGDRFSVENPEELKEKNIFYVLDCAKELSDELIASDSDFALKRLVLEDRFIGEDIIQYFDESHDFIKEAEEKGKNVMVHCSLGMSRSVSMAISYMMKEKKMSLKESWEVMKKQRTIANQIKDISSS